MYLEGRTPFTSVFAIKLLSRLDEARLRKRWLACRPPAPVLSERACDPAANAEGSTGDDIAADIERSTRLSNAFEAGVPSAKVVRLHNASHYVFRSNEAEVLRAMNDFLGKLPQP
jgi:hypothetical protein